MTAVTAIQQVARSFRRSRAIPPFLINHLSLRYGGPKGVVALDDIGFDVREGEFVSVVGPSGCGKSTLLKILAGLLPPTTGSAPPQWHAINGPRRDIGVVFQSPGAVSLAHRARQCPVAGRRAGPRQARRCASAHSISSSSSA